MTTILRTPYKPVAFKGEEEVLQALLRSDLSTCTFSGPHVIPALLDYLLPQLPQTDDVTTSLEQITRLLLLRLEKLVGGDNTIMVGRRRKHLEAFMVNVGPARFGRGAPLTGTDLDRRMGMHGR